MKRVAFTIILNGKHHLEHQNFVSNMLQWFDYWAIVEGASDNNGSSSWLKPMPEAYHRNGASTDGTCEYLEELAAKHDNVLYIPSNGKWYSKESMCNAGLQAIKQYVSNGWLWQVDVDEIWTEEKLIRCEQALQASGAKTGLAQFNHFVGPGMVARGRWGDGWVERLWNWEGEEFKSHDPPIFHGGNGTTFQMPEKYDHYSYYFEEDVKFKDTWYTHHQSVYDGWKSLQGETQFPQPIKRLFPRSRIGRWDSWIERYP